FTFGTARASTYRCPCPPIEATEKSFQSRSNSQHRNFRSMPQFTSRGTMQDIAEEPMAVAASNQQVKLFLFRDARNFVFRFTRADAHFTRDAGLADNGGHALHVFHIATGFFVGGVGADETGGGA